MDPLYLADESGFERIVVVPDSLQQKDFDGFITCTEDHITRKEIRLKNNVHGTTFYRTRDGKLFGTGSNKYGQVGLIFPRVTTFTEIPLDWGYCIGVHYCLSHSWTRDCARQV